MKKFFISSFVLLLFFSVAVAKQIVIGAPMSSFSDKWQTYLHDGIRKFDRKNNDVTIKLTDANDDPARMLNDIDNFIDAGVDALLVVPTDVATAKPIAKKAKRAGIPLIVVNRLPDKKTMKNVTTYVGSESIQAGILQAQEVVKLIDGKKANVAILMGPLGHEAQIQRTAGNKQVFAKYKNIKVVTTQEAKWDRAKALQITEDLLQSNRGINVIVANNDEMAIGALLAARKMGYKDSDLIIAGIDATPDALEYLGKGLDVTVFQSAIGQGYGGAKIAYEIAKGKKSQKYHWIDFELVTPDLKEKYQAKY